MLNIKTNNQEQTPVNRKGTTNREEKINELLSRIRGIEFEIVDKEINIVLDLHVANTGYSKRGELEELCERPNIDGDIDEGIKKCGYFVHQLLFLSGINKDYHFKLSMKSSAVNVQQPVQVFDKSKHAPVPQKVLNQVQLVACEKQNWWEHLANSSRIPFEGIGENEPQYIVEIDEENKKKYYIWKDVERLTEWKDGIGLSDEYKMFFDNAYRSCRLRFDTNTDPIIQKLWIHNFVNTTDASDMKLSIDMAYDVVICGFQPYYYEPED